MNHPYMGVIVPASALIPISVVIVKNRSVSREIKTLFFYLLISLAISLVSTTLAVNHISNLFLIHADTVIEAVLLLYFFYLIFPHPIAKKWILLLMITFPLFCMGNLIFLQGPHRYNTYSRPVEAIIFIGLSMLYWWHAGNNTNDQAWTNIPLNWVISGLLLYFSSSFLLFIFSNFILSKYDTSVNIVAWNIHATLILTMYLLFAVGFSKCKT